MKVTTIIKSSVCMLAVCAVASSCTTIVDTATTLDIRSQMKSAVAADVTVGARDTYTMTPSKPVLREGTANVLRTAEAELLAKHNADVLLAPEFTYTKKRGLFSSKITSVTVSGRPATYSNFHMLNDSVWSNPTFNGLRPIVRGNIGHGISSLFGHKSAGIKAPKEPKMKAERSGIRKTGYAGFFEAAVGIDGPGTPDPTIGLTTVHGWMMNPQLFVGLGSGITAHYDNGIYVPLFLDVRGYSSPNQKFSPFAELRIGGSVYTDSRPSKGFMFSPGAGISIGLGSRCALDLALRYTLTTCSKNDYYSHSDKGFNDGIIHNGTFTLGIRF